MRRNYEGLLFDRRHKSSDDVSRVLGVGHPAIDRPLLQATSWTKSAALIPVEDLSMPMAVFRVTDRITGTGGQVRSVVVGIEVQSETQSPTVLCDWRLLLRLNDLVMSKKSRTQSLTASSPEPTVVRELLYKAETALTREIPSMDLPFRFPTLTLLAVLWPDSNAT